VGNGERRGYDFDASSKERFADAVGRSGNKTDYTEVDGFPGASESRYVKKVNASVMNH